MNLRCGEAGLEVRCLATRRVVSALMGSGRPLGGRHGVPQRRNPAARQQRLPLQGLDPVLQYPTRLLSSTCRVAAGVVWVLLAGSCQGWVCTRVVMHWVKLAHRFPSHLLYATTCSRTHLGSLQGRLFGLQLGAVQGAG